MKASEPVLFGHDLSVSYGGVKAVSGVSLRVDRGEIVGLIGPNGAGKTSCIDGISGFAAMSGDLRLNGHILNSLPAHKRNHLGLSRTWQTVGLFSDLTVRENVTIAAGRYKRSSQLVQEALESLGLEVLAHRLPGELSHGQRVLVGVARAIVNKPSLVLMDEPAAGLDDAEGIRFGNFVKRVAKSGTGVLLVDHDMNLVLDVCDRIYVLDFGQLIAEGTPDQVMANPAVIRAYLGTSESEDEQHKTAMEF